MHSSETSNNLFLEGAFFSIVNKKSVAKSYRKKLIYLEGAKNYS
jgi:hypothetical protein